MVYNVRVAAAFRASTLGFAGLSNQFDRARAAEQYEWIATMLGEDHELARAVAAFIQRARDGEPVDAGRVLIDDVSRIATDVEAQAHIERAFAAFEASAPERARPRR